VVVCGGTHLLADGVQVDLLSHKICTDRLLILSRELALRAIGAGFSKRSLASSAMRAVLGELGRTLQNRLIIDDLPTPPFPMMITLISAADAHEWFVR
jgi:hypothetical protein